ncbi:MAG: futalosine hydrolase [Nitrospirae bacterium]|nr:futalosine hydrolase [Nitrospirota bacterium]
MKFLALLSSVPFESDIILSRLKNVRINRIAGKDVYEGRLSGSNIILSNTGMGKTNAAHSITSLAENYQIRYVINFGIGGAYPNSGLGVGDLAVAEKEIYGDEGVVTSRGWEGIREIGIPLLEIGKKKYFNEFPFDKRLSRKAISLLNLVTRHSSLVTKVRSGNFITVSTVSGTHKKALEIEKRFNAICENMEGAAIAHICAMYKIPMIELRGISNIVGVRDKRKWNLRLASEGAQSVVLKIINPKIEL